MKKILLSFSCISLVLTSCEDFGDRIEVNNKSEVYYKGEGLTEGEAKRLGNFLLKQHLFDNTSERSVQLTKDSGAYVVRFVFNRDMFEKDKENTLLGFKVWQMWIADSVFNGAKTKVMLTDNSFNEYQDVGEFTADEKAAVKAEQEGILNPEANATAADSSRVEGTSTSTDTTQQ